MLSYFLIAIGGALGSVARHWMSGFVTQRFGEGFPLGTVLVNILGSFLIGFFATFTAPDGRMVASTPLRQFVMVGIFGGFTTFSAFSLQTLDLAREGQWLSAGLNVVVSVICCLVAVWLGHLAAALLSRS